jgi:hypothetical protein
MRWASALGLSSGPARRCAEMTRINIRFGTPQEHETEPTWVYRNLIVRPQFFEDQIPLPQFRPGGLLVCLRPVYVKRHVAVHSLLQKGHGFAIMKGWQLIPLCLLFDACPETVDGFLTFERYPESVGSLFNASSSTELNTRQGPCGAMSRTCSSRSCWVRNKRLHR